MKWRCAVLGALVVLRTDESFSLCSPSVSPLVGLIVHNLAKCLHPIDSAKDPDATLERERRWLSGDCWPGGEMPRYDLHCYDLHCILEGTVTSSGGTRTNF